MKGHGDSFAFFSECLTSAIVIGSNGTNPWLVCPTRFQMCFLMRIVQGTAEILVGCGRRKAALAEAKEPLTKREFYFILLFSYISPIRKLCRRWPLQNPNMPCCFSQICWEGLPAQATQFLEEMLRERPGRIWFCSNDYLPSHLFMAPDRGSLEEETLLPSKKGNVLLQSAYFIVPNQNPRGEAPLKGFFKHGVECLGPLRVGKRAAFGASLRVMRQAFGGCSRVQLKLGQNPEAHLGEDCDRSHLSNDINLTKERA